MPGVHRGYRAVRLHVTLKLRRSASVTVVVQLLRSPAERLSVRFRAGRAAGPPGPGRCIETKLSAGAPRRIASMRGRPPGSRVCVCVCVKELCSRPAHAARSAARGGRRS